MKVSYTTESGRLTFEAELPSVKHAFEFVALLQEIFEEPECGCCHSKNIKHQSRIHQDNQYLNLSCADCGAQLDIGQKKDGKGIFVKRWDKDAQQAKPNKGWYVYNRGSRTSDNYQTSGYKKPNGPGNEEAPF